MRALRAPALRRAWLAQALHWHHGTMQAGMRVHGRPRAKRERHLHIEERMP